MKPAARVPILSIFAIFLAVVLFVSSGCRKRTIPEKKEKRRGESGPETVEKRLSIDDGRAEIEQFHKFEVIIPLPEGLTVEDTFRFDAYDADNDGKYVRAVCEFTHSETGGRVVVPAFFCRESPDGTWRLMCRFLPRLAGEWRYSAIVRYALDGEEKVEVGEEGSFTCIPTTETGPMIKPGPGQNPNCLYRLKPDGGREAFWGISVCRPWVVGNAANKHFRDEWIDRETELFGPMREHGCNLLYMWMAPWELLTCHKDPAEYWQIVRDGKAIDGAFERHPLARPEQWRPFAYYDQGRAAAMDRILEIAEKHDDRCGGPIYVFLSFMPHQVLLTKKGQWDGEYDPAELETYTGEAAEKLFGLADFGRRMEWLEWFDASPGVEGKEDWRRQDWAWQANFARYGIARWGYSRSLGMWVVMDELDGMGETGALRSENEGWWSTPECDRWHDDFLRMFRGELEGYDGDPFGHLITSSTMFYDHITGEDVNGTWDGGKVKVDAVTYHSYPVMRVFGEWITENGRPKYQKIIDETDDEVYGVSAFHSNLIPAGTSTWAYAAERVHNWSIAVGEGTTRMITESGFIERPAGEHRPDFYGKKYPTVYHYQLWAALVSGLASAPFDWNAGKEFGEMRWRDRKGEFSRENYPIDLYAELGNVRRFLRDEEIERYRQLPDERIETPEGLTVWCIADGSAKIMGWAFVDSENAATDGKFSFTLNGLDPEARYSVQWFNTWTGEAIGRPVEVENIGGKLLVKASEFLPKSVIEPEKGPNDFENNPDDWSDDGKDAAFKIVRD